MKLTTENTENTEQDTPETDEVRRATDCNALGYGLMTLHACKLERERDEARESLESWRWLYGIQTERLERMKRERDKAREWLAAAQNALDAIHLQVGSWIKKLKKSK